MADTVIGDLFVRLGINATELDRGLTAAEKRLDRFGTQMFFLGTRITAGISIPVGIAMKKIEEFGAGFDNAMTESLAIMNGITAGMRSDMEAVAKAVSASGKFGPEKAAEGYYSLASAGLSASAAMGALPIAARFAQAGVFDLAKATEFLAGAQASMSEGFKTSSQQVAEMAHIADVLTLANNRALGTVEDFAEALTNRAGAALRQSNKSVEEGVAVLSAYAEQNIRGKFAGQQLWMMIRDLGIYAQKNAGAFKKYNISVFDHSGAMKNLADIIGDVERATSHMSDAQKAQMFIQLGIPARSVAATKALIGYSSAIHDHEIALRGAAGTTQEVSDKQMLSFQNRMTALGHQFQIAAIDLFKSFVPAIEQYFVPLVEKAADVARELVRVLDSLPAPLKAILLAAAGLAVVIGPVTAAIGSFTLLGSAAARGIGLVAGGLGTFSKAAGVSAGASSTLVKFLTIMPPNAALASAAAYDLAKAQGVSGIFLNRTATAAANSAGWMGTVTNATVAAGVAQAKLDGTLLTGLTTFGKVNIALGILTGAILAVQAYTGDWGETLKVMLIPGYGLVTLLGDLNSKLINHGGTMGDVARIIRDVFVISVDSAKTAINEFIKALGGVSAVGTAVWKSFGQDIQDFVLERLAELGTVLSMLPGGSQFVGFVANLRKNMKDLGTDIHNTADAMDRLAGFGTYKGKAGSKDVTNLMTGGFAPFSMVQPKEGFSMGGGSPFDPKKFEEGGLGDMPQKLNAAQTAAQNLAQTWLENSKNVRAFTDAWATLSNAQKHDPEVLDHIWQSYDHLRQTQGVTIAQFDKLFASQIEQQEIQKDIMYGTNEWAVTWSDAMIKMDAEAGKVYMTLLNIKDKADLDSFWKKNGDTVESLIPFYAKLDPMLRVVVDRYQQWALATAQATGALEEMQSKASTAIGDYLKDTAAKLTDTQSELALFSKSYAGRELVGLKKGLAQQEVAREQSYRDQLKHLSAFASNPVLFAAEMARLNAAKANNAKISEAEYRLGLYRVAQSVGVNKNIIKDFEHMTDAQIIQIIRQKDAWNDLMVRVTSYNAAISAIGELASTAGLGEMGTMLSNIGSALDTVTKGADTIANAENMGQRLAGVATMITGTIKAFQALNDVGSHAGRIAGGALAGAQIGSIAGPWGAAAGAVIGGLVGLFKGDPGWKKVQDAISSKWGESVTKELANQIDKDAKILGGRTNAMLMHLMDVVNENGGLTSSNVGTWATRLADTFKQLSSGAMTAGQAAKTLDGAFGDLLTVGTASNGMLNDQVRNLVLMEKQYKTGSTAIRDFIDAQLGMAATGMNALAKGTFGTVLSFLDDAEAADTKLEDLNTKAAKLAATIKDFKKTPPSNEKQKVALLIAQRDLLKTNYEIQQQMAKQAAADAMINSMMGPEGQNSFDRQARIMQTVVGAMAQSGKGLFETLDALGPAFDTLIAAQKTFGLTSTESFNNLMQLREFQTLHPDLVAAIEGLNQVMLGLSNTGYMTSETFADLGGEATSVFNDLVANGMTSDQAFQAMQPTLQTLWMLQKKFGFAVDDTTQALLDQAEANGTVGEQYMSANDKMVLGIDKLIGRFDLFLRHLGIDIPSEAEAAAGAVEGAFNDIHPKVRVEITYDDQGMPTPGGKTDPVPMAEGGVLTRPILAGEAGPEAIIPLDRLFAELENQRKADSGGEYLPISVSVGDEQLMRVMVKLAKRKGWTR